MHTVAVDQRTERVLRTDAWLMGLAAVGFIGYAVLFLVPNFTNPFLELGIGPNEGDVGAAAVLAQARGRLAERLAEQDRSRGHAQTELWRPATA